MGFIVIQETTTAQDVILVQRCAAVNAAFNIVGANSKVTIQGSSSAQSVISVQHLKSVSG